MKIDLELKGLDKYFQQGLDLLNQGKYQEGLDKFKESLNENPQYLPTYKNLAHIYLGLQQPSQLLNTMEEALKFDNKSAWIWYSKGYALKLLNRLDESIADLNQCLNLEPKDCDTLTLLANIYKNKKDYEKAIEYYNITLEVDPFYDLARNNKLLMLKELNRIDEIKATCEDAAEKYCAKGLEYQNHNNPITSAIYYGGALKYIRDHTPAKENMEKAIEEINQNHKLVSMFGFIPFTITKWDRRGLIFYDMGNIKNSTISEIGKLLVNFRSKFEIPNNKLFMVSHKEKTLSVIEIFDGAFKKFNLIYQEPFFGLNLDREFTAFAPHQGSLEAIAKEFGIKEVHFPSWVKYDLNFYSVGNLKDITVGELYELINILRIYLKIDPERIKMFPTKETFIAAIEKYPGAFKPFQKALKIKPIEVRFK